MSEYIDKRYPYHKDYRYKPYPSHRRPPNDLFIFCNFETTGDADRLMIQVIGAAVCERRKSFAKKISPGRSREALNEFITWINGNINDDQTPGKLFRAIVLI